MRRRNLPKKLERIHIEHDVRHTEISEGKLKITVVRSSGIL